MAGLYVHIPLCASKCFYCDFYSGPFSSRSHELVDALLTEWKLRSDLLSENIETLYIGGGTPSQLPIEELSRLLDALPSPSEITVEVNPEDVDENYIRGLVNSGVNRISMGVQSLCDDELRAVGRRHTAARAMEAYAIIRGEGIDNISLDLIYGLPGQTLDSWRRSLEGVISLGPEHLSAYMLSWEPGTKLWAMRKAGRISESSDELLVEMYIALCSLASSSGYEHYEISNFALPGKKSRHNSSYWDMTPYLGLGPGAFSYIDEKRGSNAASLKDYLNAKGIGTYSEEEQKPTDLANDMIFTALRTSKGLVPSKLGDYEDGFMKAAEPLLANGQLVRTSDGALRLTEQAWLIADPLIARLLVE